MDVQKIRVNKTFGHIYGDSVGTPAGRVVWVSLAEPKPGFKQPDGTEGRAKYETSLLLQKTDKNTIKFLATLKPYVDQMVKAFNSGKKTKITIDEVLRDGDDAEMYNPEKGPYYAGNWVLRARHSEQPIVCSTKKGANGWEEIDPKLIQGGCLCREVVSPMITSGGQLTYLLSYVQLVADDGTRFGGGFDKRAVGGLLSGDDFDDNEVTAEDAADEALTEETEDEESEDSEDEGAESKTDEDENGEDEEAVQEELPLVAKKRGRPAGRKGKQALIDRL